MALDNITDDSRYRFVVDQKEDLEVVSKIIENLYEPNRKPFGMEEIKKFLDANSEIFSINSNVVRNQSFDALAEFGS